MEDLDKLVELVIKEGASDLHIAEDRNPILRISGQLVPLLKYPKSSKSMLEDVLAKVLTNLKKKTFETLQSADFAYMHNGERFRSHAFVDQQRICIAFRHIPKKIPALNDLQLVNKSVR